jgi:hypothetical protein
MTCPLGSAPTGCRFPANMTRRSYRLDAPGVVA